MRERSRCWTSPPPYRRRGRGRGVRRVSCAARAQATVESAMIASVPRRSSDLLREVIADVDSDEPRTVLADALQARGDPQGELIALQLAAARDPTNPALRERIDQIVRASGREWLGELSAVTYRAQFQRGFLTRLELAGSSAASDDGWTRHVADLLLGTVEELVPGRATSELYAR